MARALVIKTYGDNDIASAIVAGITANAGAKEMDWTKIAALVRDAVGNTKTAEDYACMVAKSNYEYSIGREHGRMYRAILGVWALLWLDAVGWYEYFKAINREG